MKNLSLYLLSIISCNSILSQEKFPIPRNIEKTYAKGTRSTEGNPGKSYWQNTASYNINAELNPESLLIKGSETIDYTNNSPDTLYELLFKLYPNLYAKGAVSQVKISPTDVGEGMVIQSLSVDNNDKIPFKIDGTNMTAKSAPILPGKTVRVHVAFQYRLNKNSHYRTGQVDENAFFVAYFFPRIAVYDDIDGWNRNPYVGTQEFYNDFCHFNAAITVPNGFMVWATGDLKNCNDVLQQPYCDRLQKAASSNTPIIIIDSIEVVNGGITKSNTSNTWLFEADNVTDFVFATSKHYVWHSASIIVDSNTQRRTRCDAVFNPAHRDYYDVLHYTRESVRGMSYFFPKWPFPYSHITVFDGLDQMEYPMMVNDSPLEKFDAITTTDHEVFHTMFPFYMGINETKYGWMDEGWATIGEWLISPFIDSTIQDDYGMKRYDTLAGYEEDVPIVTLSTQLTGNAFFMNSYVKPGLGYLYVKDYLGDELFTKSLHYYISQWQGKHPMPYDFFNCMNKASGKNLNWFWNSWFFQSGYPDLAIGKVKINKNKCRVTIEKIGNKPVPIDLTFTLDNGSVVKEHRTISVWENGNKSTDISINLPAKVVKIKLGSLYAADVNKQNNELKF